MDNQEERKFLYSMMQSITEERKNLTEIYLELMKRINKLDVQESNINSNNPTSFSPMIEDEESHSNVVIDDKTVEGKTLQEYIDFHNQNLKDDYSRNEDSFYINNDIIPKSEIEKEKDKLPRKNVTLNMDKVSGLIVLILKEKGAPISVKEIHRELNERLELEVTMQNLRNNILPRVCKKNPRIERATRGYYQYKF